MLSYTKSRLAEKNLFLLFIAFLLFQLNTLAQEGWFWQHPSPQGNDLRDVFVMNENTIFAVGDRGTLLRSDNAGADWEITHRLADISENIVDIEFISDQKGFLLANKYLLDDQYNYVYSSSKILLTEDSGIHWKVIDDFDSLRLNDLCFIDDNIGWLIGYSNEETLTGMIFKTTNGGYTWDTMYVQNTNYSSFSTIQFIDSENGWAAGKSADSFETNGELLKTTDGGFNWSLVNDSLNVISSFQFVNLDIGWLIESGPGWMSTPWSIKKSTDGGFNWEDVLSGGYHFSAVSLPSLYFIDPNVGWVQQSGQYSRRFHRTTDGGLSWLTDTLHTPWNGAMHFNDELNGCVVGKNGEIFSTQDGGQSWIERSTMTTYAYDTWDSHFSSVHFYDDNIGWASAWCTIYHSGEGYRNYNRIFKTSDGGSSWIEQYFNFGVGCSMDDIQAITDQIVYAVSHGVYKTTNGGTNWNHINSAGYGGYHSLFFLNADTGFVGGKKVRHPFGTIAKTTNGGMAWDTVLSVYGNSIESLFFISNSVGWALCGNSIYKTIDEGDTWQEIAVNDYGLKSICFINADIGLAVGRSTSGDGVIIRSIDGGYNWDVVYILNGYELRSVCFSDSNRGFVVGLDNSYLLNNHNYNISGIILSTDDAGGNWSVKQESWTKGLNDVYFLNNNTGWAVGYGGTVIKTTTGGVVFVEEEEIDEIPTDYNLTNNFPNPFNPSTKIKYTVPQSSQVIIKVYDILGNEIETLVSEEKQTGIYEITWNAANLPSGVYFYQLRAGNFIETKKMVLIK